jgi:hypothetical protein
MGLSTQNNDVPPQNRHRLTTVSTQIEMSRRRNLAIPLAVFAQTVKGVLKSSLLPLESIRTQREGPPEGLAFACRSSEHADLDEYRQADKHGRPALRSLGSNKQTPWPLVRKRTIPTERPPLDEI